MAQLESENQRLKGSKAQERKAARREQREKQKAAKAAAKAAAAEGAEGAEAAAAQGGKAAKKQKKEKPAKPAKAPKQQAKQGKQQQPGQGGGEEAAQRPLADVSAWRPFELHPLVERALARLGFSEPTRVQEECIPAAVRDRRDVIGAAQTVGGRAGCKGGWLGRWRDCQHQAGSAAASLCWFALVLAAPGCCLP